MLYFAYGSCMDPEDFRRTCPTAKLVAVRAELRNHRLTFNGRSLARGGGVANIEPAKGHVVRGVLWEVTSPRGVEALDRREGAPWMYERRRRKVYVGERPVWAQTYVLTRPLPFEVAPSEAYAALILGAVKHDRAYHELLRQQIARLKEERVRICG
ncbi:MAG: gamma-glutamylcyclotransferase [Alicyclobacillus sp.]|nr:gamma-glutamylcyclotransferase [Alicyclobacillus sp.]